MFFPSLGFAAVRSSIVCVFVHVANFLGLEFSFQQLCGAGFVTRYWLNPALSWNMTQRAPHHSHRAKLRSSRSCTHSEPKPVYGAKQNSEKQVCSSATIERTYCRNSFNAPWESEHQPTWRRPRYEGSHPLYMKQTLLRTCHSWIGPLLPVPGDASGVGRDSNGKLPTRVRSPGGEARCQRHLVMENVAAALYRYLFIFAILNA